MKRYPEYKDSGVEFIGEIPAHWEIKKLGYVSKIFKGGTPKRHIDRYFQGDLPWARPVDITALNGALYIDDTEIHISEEALGNSAARRLPVGTVLLTSRATIGETAITTVPMATNQGFANFVCDEALFNNYLVYYLRAIKDWLISLGSGTTFLEVTKRTLVGLKMPLPPLSEQTQIANFLNRKTEQIDELIHIKERMVELLQEQRTALVHETVTKGLDPNVEMKSSGVEWIGDIPKHWQMKRLKYVTEFIKNGTTATQIESGETDYPVTRIETISTGEINFDKVGYVNYWDGIENYRLRLGDILLSHINSLAMLGNCAMLEDSACLYHGMNLLRIRSNSLVDNRFLLYWLKSSPANQLIKSFAKFAIGQVSISITNLKEIPVGYPPPVEQTQIVNFLDHKTAKIDELRSNEQRSLELLKEYRHTLISEVVTGKLDVRSEV